MNPTSQGIANRAGVSRLNESLTMRQPRKIRKKTCEQIQVELFGPALVDLAVEQLNFNLRGSPAELKIVVLGGGNPRPSNNKNPPLAVSKSLYRNPNIKYIVR